MERLSMESNRAPDSLSDLRRSPDGSFAIYVHVPFCRRICPYCDFVVGLPAEDAEARFLRSFERDVLRWGGEGSVFRRASVDAVYFGGGTPSYLSGTAMERCLDAVRDSFTIADDAEISLEANPEDVSPERASAWCEAGINRVSVGVQAMDLATLKRLGRRHSPEEGLAALECLVEAGIANRSADLIAGIPGQSTEEWDRALESILAARTDHLSIYCLTIHDGTPFARLRARGELSLDDDRQAECYGEAVTRAEAAGFQRYEVSNFSRPGREGRYNFICWGDGDYLGLGPGASSHCDGVRWRNDPDISAFLDGMVAPPEVEHLTPAQRQLEVVFLGLRRPEGIDGDRFMSYAGQSLEEACGRALERTGAFLQAPDEQGVRWRLRPEHLLLADAIADVFAEDLQGGAA